MLILSALILFAYAGAEMGFLLGGLLICGFSYFVAELMWRHGRTYLEGALASLLTMALLFLAGWANNIVRNSILVGMSLQKISVAGIIVFALLGLDYLLRRKS